MSEHYSAVIVDRFAALPNSYIFLNESEIMVRLDPIDSLHGVVINESSCAHHLSYFLISMHIGHCRDPNKPIRSVLTGLKEIDDGQNKAPDASSMMNALKDHIINALKGEIKLFLHIIFL